MLWVSMQLVCVYTDANTKASCIYIYIYICLYVHSYGYIRRRVTPYICRYRFTPYAALPQRRNPTLNACDVYIIIYVLYVQVLLMRSSMRRLQQHTITCVFLPTSHSVY